MTGKRPGLFLSSTMLALAPMALILLLIPPHKVSNRYQVGLQTLKHSQPYIFYADLNGDGISERIDLIPGAVANTVHITDNDLKIYEQWNLSDTFNDRLGEIYFSDFDRDGMKEILVFTHKNDSVFLNANEFFQPAGFKLERHFITTTGLKQGVPDSDIAVAGMFDFDGNSSDELYFGITSGFTLQPRLIYRLDLSTLGLIQSPYTAINLINPQLYDVDNDGRPEIVSSNSASGNHHTPVPFSDYSAWLMVLDDQLQFKFEPREFPGFGLGLTVLPFDNGEGQRLFAAHQYTGTDTTLVTPVFAVYNSQGTLENIRPISALNIPGTFNVVIMRGTSRDRIVILSDPLIEINSSLEAVKEITLNIAAPIMGATADADGDGNDELYVYSPGANTLRVMGPDLEPYGEVTTASALTTWAPSYFTSANGQRKLHVKSGDNNYLIEIRKQPMYWLGYFVYPGVFLFFAGFIYAVRKVNTVQVEKREAARRALLSLQLQNVKAQLNPHFTFNVLNAVASLIYMDDRKAAYDQLNTFTRMLRTILSDAERPYRSLKEELEFVKQYVALEKLRFGDKFECLINLGADVTGDENVPVLSIQTFTENAIQHGLMHRAGGGLLTLVAERRDGFLHINIEDNGVGRKKALELNPRDGKGLKIMAQFHEILNQMSGAKDKISTRFVDLHDAAGAPAGTRIEVAIPLRQRGSPE